MEIRKNLGRNRAAIALLPLVALLGCTVDSYLTDPSAVRCDGKRTKAALGEAGMATFIVRGEAEGNVASVQILREADTVKVRVDGDVTGPPQQLDADGFTKAINIVDGAELTAFAAGGAWVIDVREDSVVIQGSCDGM
jgi:hypothetical protein